MRWILLLALSISAYQNPEVNFRKYESLFKIVLNQYWDTYQEPWHLCGQIEQESNWNPNAELKTKREDGFGFSQTTIAYDAYGDVRFNNFDAEKAKYKELSGWTWSNRKDPKYNLMALIFTDKTNYSAFSFFTDFRSRADGTVTAYNSGAGTIIHAYKTCMDNADNTDICGKWIGGSQKYVSLSSKSLGARYGNKSPKQINGEYPGLINQRKQKYIKYFLKK